MQLVGIQSILTIISHLFFIWITVNIFQSVNVNAFFKRVDPRQIKILLIFLEIAIGYTVSSFFISIITAIQNLKFLF